MDAMRRRGLQLTLANGLPLLVVFIMRLLVCCRVRVLVSWLWLLLGLPLAAIMPSGNGMVASRKEGVGVPSTSHTDSEEERSKEGEI